MDTFTYQGVEFSVQSAFAKELARKWAIECAEEAGLQNDVEYIDGKTEQCYEDLDDEFVYESAVKAGLICTIS